MLLHGLLSLKHMPAAQQQAWQQFIRHYLLEENGDPGEHLPDQAKGILGEMTPQLAQGIARWLTTQLK